MGALNRPVRPLPFRYTRLLSSWRRFCYTSGEFSAMLEDIALFVTGFRAGDRPAE
ncbi:MAG: hypothetical protein ACLR9W_13420 [Enterobacter hormaechei]